MGLALSGVGLRTPLADPAIGPCKQTLLSGSVIGRWAIVPRKQTLRQAPSSGIGQRASQPGLADEPCARCSIVV